MEKVLALRANVVAGLFFCVVSLLFCFCLFFFYYMHLLSCLIALPTIYTTYCLHVPYAAPLFERRVLNGA